jgi:hypothetical protein
MPATPEAQARTRAFARVFGPFLVIVPSIVIGRLSQDMGAVMEAFFGNPALVWIMGALLLFGGIFIIAQHQYWSSVAAVIISLFGWLLALRGLALLLFPRHYERAGEALMGALPLCGPSSPCRFWLGCG